MVVTKTEMTTRIASKLRVAPAGQPVPAIDADDIGRALQDSVSKLRRQDIIHWDAESTPNWAAEDLANYVTGVIGYQYYSDPSLSGPFEIRKAQAEMELRKLTAQHQSSDKYVHSDYF